MKLLFDKLTEHGNSDIYPLHMPGHKRNSCGLLPAEMYQRDITEIDGFDNLHQPEGILLDLQKKAAKLYGADESFYLVNGSTAGILCAVSAALWKRGRILMARNCHKSVYHAVYLRELEVSYLYPDIIQDFGICEAVTAKQVETALEKDPDIGAVLVVSPTYEGRIADIRAIATLVHKRGIPLIVDEAHGAHLGFSEITVENSCRLGADLVIHSVHKTMPSLTQTALLHVQGNLISRERLMRFLHIYQSSSPSYLLMASIDNALDYVAHHREKLYRDFYNNYHRMLKELSGCHAMDFLPENREQQDIGKLVISVKDTEMTGKQLYDLLLKKYQLQPEMAGETYVLAMFTLNDTEEGYRRLTDALLHIDSTLHRVPSKKKRQNENQNSMIPSFKMLLSDAWDADCEMISLMQATGRYSGDFVNLYPPGIPILVPGEVITKEISDRILDWIRQGLTVQGVHMKNDIPYLKVTETNQANSLTDKSTKKT